MRLLVVPDRAKSTNKKFAGVALDKLFQFGLRSDMLRIIGELASPWRAVPPTQVLYSICLSPLNLSRLFSSTTSIHGSRNQYRLIERLGLVDAEVAASVRVRFLYLDLRSATVGVGL
jgi:hypothetical protein